MARRFLVPVAICLVVRFTYFGNTLTVLLPALRQDLVISQFGIAGLGQPTMTEDVKDNRHAGLRYG
jgi:hypothetical protein